jgi:hypothetical protein
VNRYEFLLALFSIITGGVVATTLIATVGRYFIRRRESRGAELSEGSMARLDERLQRMEQGIDAMAVEIERISEGQRFTTRLLSERSGERLNA